jgi:DNA polymerase III delta prime subunit
MDKDIRNFFKSSADKTSALGNKSQMKVEISKEKVSTKLKEENIIKDGKNIDVNPKKGRKRKGADFDKEEKSESNADNEPNTKRKKINNSKNKESKKIIENPLPIERVKIKVDSKNKKIIEDDDENIEEYVSTTVINNLEKQSKIEEERKYEIPMASVITNNSTYHTIVNQENSSNSISNKTNLGKALVKPEENKKILKPVEAGSFFSARASITTNANNYKEDLKILEPPEKKEKENIVEAIREDNNEKQIIPMDVDEKVKLDEFDDFNDFNIDEMDLDMIAKDMFDPEVETKRAIESKPVLKCENEYSYTKKLEVLEIQEEKKQQIPIQSNPIFNNRTIKPEEIIKSDNYTGHVETKSITSDNVIANRFIHNIQNKHTNKNTLNQIDTSANQNMNNFRNNISINNTSINKDTVNKANVQINLKTNTSSLWTDKYHPKTIEEIIGNQGVVKKLIEWLNHWDEVVLHGNKRELDFASNNNYTTRGKSKIENINARACMISGPPGIGKTTTVRLVAKILNYRTFELNASDQRNKQIIDSTVGYLMDNKTISNRTITNKNIIIMDEVDGMGGNEDKGGIKALIDIIKKTKLPIICICNDIQNQKIRNLLNYCYELKFAKPDKRFVAKRLGEICRMEKFNISPESLEYLCESVGNDIRQCINFLEMRSRSNNILNHQEMKDNYDKLYSKDSELMISVFDSCKKMLTKNEFRKLRFGEKMDLFFIDFDLLPSLIYVIFKKI